MSEEIRNSDLLAKCKAAVEWLHEETGMSKGTRYDTYLKIWEEIIERSDLPNGGTSDQQIILIQQKFGLEGYRGAVHEVTDLIQIHEAFHHGNRIPPSLLKKIVAGKDSEIEEDRDKPHSSQPRNYLFELSVAATFKTHGFSVKVGEDADVIFNFQNHRVFVECKRLFSEESFERNIVKASSQLLYRYQSFGLPVNIIGQIPIGIGVYSVSKIINPSQDYLKAESRTAAIGHLDKEIYRLWKRRESLIKSKNHENTILTGFYVRTPLILPQGFGTLRRWKFFSHHANSHRLSNISGQIINKLLKR